MRHRTVAPPPVSPRPRAARGRRPLPRDGGARPPGGTHGDDRGRGVDGAPVRGWRGTRHPVLVRDHPQRRRRARRDREGSRPGPGRRWPVPPRLPGGDGRSRRRAGVRTRRAPARRPARAGRGRGCARTRGLRHRFGAATRSAGAREAPAGLRHVGRPRRQPLSPMSRSDLRPEAGPPAPCAARPEGGRGRCARAGSRGDPSSARSRSGRSTPG